MDGRAMSSGGWTAALHAVSKCSAQWAAAVSLFLLLLSSCAPVARQEMDSLEDSPARGDRCVPLKEEQVRLFLYQSKVYWDAVGTYVEVKQREGLVSERASLDFAVQDREFTKYYINALMLFLRGDTSSDCGRSLVTVKKLLLGLAASYPNMNEDVSSVKALDDDCIKFLLLPDDPVRNFLYRAKTFWDEFNSKVMSLQIQSGGYNETFEWFREMNEEYSTLYDKALNSYLRGEDSSERMSETLSDLEGLIERAMEMPGVR